MVRFNSAEMAAITQIEVMASFRGRIGRILKGPWPYDLKTIMYAHAYITASKLGSAKQSGPNTLEDVSLMTGLSKQEIENILKRQKLKDRVLYYQYDMEQHDAGLNWSDAWYQGEQ